MTSRQLTGCCANFLSISLSKGQEVQSKTFSQILNSTPAFIQIHWFSLRKKPYTRSIRLCVHSHNPPPPLEYR